MSTTWLSVFAGDGFANVVATSAATVALFAFWAAVRANRTSRVALTVDVRREWEELRLDWATTIMLCHGPDYYYVDAPIEHRDRIRALATSLVGGVESISRNIQLVKAESRAVRRVVRFLAYCGRLVLEGRLSVKDAYYILGPEVVSQGRTIRWACGTLKIRDDPFVREWSSSEWADFIDEIPLGQYHDEQDVILALVDVLWAEMARNGDHHAYILLRVAAHKRKTGSGRASRERIRRLTLKSGSYFTGLRLSKLLRYSESLPFNAVFGPRRDPITKVDARLIRRTLGSAWLTRKRARLRRDQSAS